MAVKTTASKRLLTAILLPLVLLISWLAATFTLPHSTSHLPSFSSLKSLNSFSISRTPLIPRQIWQTWLDVPSATSPSSPPADFQSYSQTWPARNPGYAHTLLTNPLAEAFISTHYSQRPEIGHLFSSLSIPVLRADLIRYLVLAAIGGIYTDLDTECFRSIDLWSSGFDSTKVGMVIGLEYDQRTDENRMGGTAWRVQVRQWTIAARQGHPVMRHVLETVVERLLEVERERGGFVVENQGDVLNMTGPRVFTEAIRQGISLQMGREMDYAEFSMLPGPKLFGDVLVHPINGFAAGVPHSGAAKEPNEESLVVHHFKGVWKAGLGDS